MVSQEPSQGIGSLSEPEGLPDCDWIWSQAGVTDDNCRHNILSIFFLLKGETYLVLFLVLFLSIFPFVPAIRHFSRSQDQRPSHEQLTGGSIDLGVTVQVVTAHDGGEVTAAGV